MTDRETAALNTIKEQLKTLGPSEFQMGYVVGMAEATAEARKRFEEKNKQKEAS